MTVTPLAPAVATAAGMTETKTVGALFLAVLVEVVTAVAAPAAATTALATAATACRFPPCPAGSHPSSLLPPQFASEYLEGSHPPPAVYSLRALDLLDHR